MLVPRFGRLVVLAGASAIGSIMLVGCGDDGPVVPRADQAGHTLKVQVYKMFIATTMIDVKVTDPAFDKYVPCGDDKVKLTYAVTGKPTTFAAAGSFVTRTETKEKAAPRAIIDDLLKYMPQVGTFAVTRSDDATARLVSSTTYTRMTVHSSGPNQLTIAGETDCLGGGNRPLH
jgi:hypothetical protein